MELNGVQSKLLGVFKQTCLTAWSDRVLCGFNPGMYQGYPPRSDYRPEGYQGVNGNGYSAPYNGGNKRGGNGGGSSGPRGNLRGGGGCRVTSSPVPKTLIIFTTNTYISSLIQAFIISIVK